MRVMVVEDDEHFVIALRWRLHRAAPHVQIVQAFTPADAIRRLVNGETFDFVITDLMFLGCSSGEDVLAAAHSRGIPAILCSDLMEMFGPKGMVRKVHFLSRPWEYMVELLAEATQAPVPRREALS